MTTKQLLAQYSNTQIEETINKWIHGECNRQILKMSFIPLIFEGDLYF